MDPTLAPVARRRIWIGAAVIVAAALGAYHNSFSGPFIFDDLPAIAHNATIERWRTALSPPAGATVSGRPLLNLSFALSYAIGGREVVSYHALNLLIHVLAGLTLFGIVRRTLGRWSALSPTRLPADGVAQRVEDNALHPIVLAFVIALLWTVHPLQTESVTYLVQRAESLMGLFYLLTLYWFIRGVERVAESATRSTPVNGDTFWFSLSFLACLFGMATKEVMVSAPVLVLLYDRSFVSGSFRLAFARRKAYYAALAATWVPLAFLAISNGNRGGTSGFNVGVPWWNYAETQFPAVLRYLALSVWPHPLVLDYGTQWVTQVGAIIPDALAVIALIGATIYFLGRSPTKPGSERGRALGFAGAFFFAILAPSSLIPGTRQTMAEHRMYLALIPVLGAGVMAIDGGLRRIFASNSRAATRVLLLLGLIGAAGLGWATVRRNERYRSERSIWSDAAAKVPGNFYAWNNLGDAYLREGRMADGLVCYEKALQLHSDFPEAQNNLAVVLEHTGRTAEAIPHFEAALRLKPDFVAVQTNLGVALVSLGRLPEAIAHLQEAWRIEPQAIEAFNLADALSLASRLPEAIALYGQAVRLDSAYLEAYVHFGVALTRAGRMPEASAQFAAALVLSPNQIEARYDRAMILFQAGKTQEAAAEFEAVLRLKPDFAEAQGNLGNALRILGRTTEALTHLREAVRLDPAGPQGHYNLGVALSGAGKLPDAIAEYQEAVRLKPDFLDALDNLGVALAKAARFPEAISRFEAALRLKPDFAPAQRNWGMALQAMGRPAEAKMHLEEADRLDAAVRPAGP